jgi:DNA-binding winged helix-turn-helix (wHTH) protein
VISPCRFPGDTWTCSCSSHLTPDRSLTKEALIDGVWDGAAVTDNALERGIWTLRKILGESHIQNVPRLGYRFTATVESGEPADEDA